MIKTLFLNSIDGPRNIPVNIRSYVQFRSLYIIPYTKYLFALTGSFAGLTTRVRIRFFKKNIPVVETSRKNDLVIVSS